MPKIVKREIDLEEKYDLRPRGEFNVFGRYRPTPRLLKFLRSYPYFPAGTKIVEYQYLIKVFFVKFFFSHLHLFDLTVDDTHCLCENHPISNVFRVKSFYRFQFPKLLQKQLTFCQ